MAATYYSGLALRELATVARRQAQATHDHALEAQARYQAGLVQLTAALRARIDFLRADSEVRRARWSGLVSTLCILADCNNGASSRAMASPLRVSGMSVLPVCCPVKDQAVSP